MLKEKSHVIHNVIRYLYTHTVSLFSLLMILSSVS